MGVMAKPDVAYYNEKGKQICGAQRNNMPGVRCQAPPLTGSLRCRKHGGTALKGPAAGAYKDGRSSRYVGIHRLQDRFESALTDTDYLSLRPELALIDAMLAERWETLEQGGNDDLWGILEKQFQDFKGAMASGDVRKMRATISDIEHTVSLGSSEALARQEIRDLIRDRQRLAESMQKTLINLKQTVTVEQTVQMLQQVIRIIGDTVDDRRQVSEVMRKIMALTQAKGAEGIVPTREVVSIDRP